VSDDLRITGGAGGVEVAIADLRAATVTIRRIADSIVRATPRDATVELPVPASPVGAADWGLAARVLGAPLELMPLVGRCRHDLADLICDVAGAVERLTRLAESAASAAASYEWGESAVQALVAGMHAQAMATAWLHTEVTGQSVGLLDEGTGWDVDVRPAAPLARVETPTTTASLLGGVESLGRDGRVRVVELPAADGTTTWVLQVPGTHAPGAQGWFEGGEIPMDWPANVSLMLRATSASKVAAARALDLAQAGRAGPRDRVVIVGHSQGGIVAAALASDPGFTADHRVSHVVTAGSPIDAFPIPASTSVLSVQHTNDAVPMLDVAPPPDRGSWTTVAVGAPAGARAHDLRGYVSTAGRAQRSGDVSLRQWRAGLAPALAPAPASTAVVHEFRTRRRWHNRDS
jgi:pimeloyl-ACP methyl ester carboxylesterase